MENKEINSENEKAKPSESKKLFLRALCLVPSILLIGFGFRQKWKMRGMELLFMDSDSGKTLRNWWIAALIGVLLAVVLVIRWIWVDHRKNTAGAFEPEDIKEKSGENDELSEPETKNVHSEKMDSEAAADRSSTDTEVDSSEPIEESKEGSEA